MTGYRILFDFARDRSAAIAPMYAIALFGLIMIAGVGWDYSRMATMDSELQNAADQAALAAATQLTGVTGARANAAAAATNFLATAGSAWANETRLANDGQGRTVGGLTYEFFQSWNHTTDVPGPVATTDANARYVRVTVDGREAFYALTAIGGVLSSGEIAAQAVATLEASACNIPPLMMCSPSNDPGFPGIEDIGIAVDMREGPQNSSEFTPGNFDLLNVDYEGVAQSDQNRTLGLNSDLLGCTAAQLQTDPGRRIPQNTAINTRFGIYPQGENFSCNTTTKDFCPAQVTRSDLVRKIDIKNAKDFDAATCTNTQGGVLVDFSEVPDPLAPKQGLPLDRCQTFGLCASFGDGIWDIDSYLNDIHETTVAAASIPGLDANGDGQISASEASNSDGRITRYEVYNWERSDPTNTLQQLAKIPDEQGKGGTLYCSAPVPIEGTPVMPSNTQKDRRVVTVAVVDCAGNNGRFDVNTFKFVDMFLIGPMIGQAGSRELKAEIIGPARRADGGSGFQNFGRKKPVLVQ